MSYSAFLEGRKVLEPSLPGDNVVISWESLDGLFQVALDTTEEIERLQTEIDDLDAKIEQLQTEIEHLQIEHNYKQKYISWRN